MNINPISVTAKTITGTKKFNSLKAVENGLLLKCQNKREIEILYIELDKIYIKKHKLNPFVEFSGIVFPFLFIYITLQYLPLYLMILVSAITIIPVFISVFNYKWYQLNVLLKDGTFFVKRVSSHNKNAGFSILNRVQKDFFNYKSSTLATT